MSVLYRDATASDWQQIQALLPRLAAFDIPSRRNPGDLWRGDAQALRACLNNSDPAGIVQVAVDDSRLVGLVFVRLKKELLSGEPSAHLEALAVADGFEGQGIATTLMARAEKSAADQGAKSMTLHVFAKNTRARALYEKLDYDGELIRYIKELD